MVHALSQIRHVLTPDGVLIDLRPQLDRWPVEIVSAGGYRAVGQVIDLPEPLSDDRAADQAMRENIERAWFRREDDAIFPFYYYWDTPKEMQEHISDNWADVINIEETLWEAIRSAWATANADARVRLRIKMSIARWKKL